MRAPTAHSRAVSWTDCHQSPPTSMQNEFESRVPPVPSRPLAALRGGLLLAAALLVLPAFAAPQAAAKEHTGHAEHAEHKAAQAAPAKKAAKAPQKTAAARSDEASDAKPAGKKSAKKGAGKKEARESKPGPLADFGDESAPADVVHVANWVSYTRNAKKKAFVIIDKKLARIYVFDPKGKLQSDAPVLLGKAVGDHTVPGIGNKPLSQIQEDEKTTPAGRFLVQPGKNTHGDDILWIDYNSAVSMHRLRKVAEEERRFERMATEDPSDNRISNGCVNVPHAFFNNVLRPAVLKYGAFVYVLPETRTPQQQFGSFDVPGGGEKHASTAAAAK